MNVSELEDNKIEAGAMVKLRSGGPNMVVDHVDGPAKIVTQWFERDHGRWGPLQRGVFHSAALFLVAPAGAEVPHGPWRFFADHGADDPRTAQLDGAFGRAFEIAERLAEGVDHDKPYTELSDEQTLALALLVMADAAGAQPEAVTTATIAERLRTSLARVSKRPDAIAASTAKLMTRVMAHAQELFTGVLGSVNFEADDPFAHLTMEQALAAALVFATAAPVDPDRTLGGRPQHAHQETP